MPDFNDLEPSIRFEDPQIRDLAQHVVDVMKVGIIKGIAHVSNPQVYPLSPDTKSVEYLTAAYFRQRPGPKQETALRNTKQLLEQTPMVMENLFGPLSKVDFRSGDSVEKQVKKHNLDDLVKLNPGYLSMVEISGNTVRLRPKITDNTENRVRRINTREIATDPILVKYIELGGKEGFLGDPIGGRGTCPDGRGKYQHYQGGSIYWSPESGAHEVHGLIRQKWESLGWETSFLGYPLTDESKTPDNIGRFNHFQGGSIYWTPGTGAHEVHGAIRAKWSTLGWETGYLGYPVTDESITPDTIGRYNHFQGGSIYWTSELGANAVHKYIRDKWESQGWENGFLGYPISDTEIGYDSNHNIDNMHCKFQGGEINWKRSRGAEVSTPLTKLQFRIRKVKCEDETNPEWPGDDEIDMGGAALSVNNGKVKKIEPFKVRHDFDDNEQKIYDPPKKFYTFDLKKIPRWPKKFVVTVVLAEVDCGGFSDYLNALIEKIFDVFVKLLSSSFGLIGELIGWVFGTLLGWLLDWLGDDPFPPYLTPLELPSVWKRWKDKKNTPEKSFWTQAHGGKYSVWFDWALAG